MSPEELNYLDEEHSTFEKLRFEGVHYWRAPAFALKDTSLFLLFERFAALFPDHPHETNTLFYLIQGSLGDFSIIITCLHFEHSALEDVKSLAEFLEQAAVVLVGNRSPDMVHVEELNHSSELLLVSFGDPSGEVIELLKNRATKVSG